MIEELPQIPIKGRLTSAEILMGTAIPALERLQIMSEDVFELLCLEWASAYLKTKYVSVRQIGGAGDKGRDIIGYYSDGSIDIYQCKHYGEQLAPTHIYKELGKLCYYTFKGEFPVPKQYYFVTSLPAGAKLLKFINDPGLFLSSLKANWDSYCRTQVTKTEVIELDGDFAEYIENFDFSIIRDKPPLELIEEYRQTQYYASRFGGGIKRFRSNIPKATEKIDARELEYVDQLFKVYEEKLATRIKDHEALKSICSKTSNHFDDQRNSFYSAESLEVFSRENFPDADPLPFEEVKSDTAVVANTTLLLNEGETGYKKLLLVLQEVQRQSFANSPLHFELKPIDKHGLCHHLVNSKKIKWI